jgi:uncharacterized protein
MSLSDGERVIIALLCDIHRGLNLKGDVDPDAIRATILGTTAKADCAGEASAILEMWSLIERGYKHLTAKEKEQVEAEAGPLGRGVRFSGFDAATEAAHRDAAHRLIEEAGTFDRFQGRNLSAHMPCLDGYRRMLSLFRPMRNGHGTDIRLDVRQIIDLANAEKHPG